MGEIDKKRDKERNVIKLMISVYCRGHKHKKSDNSVLCDECNELLVYAYNKIDKCPFMKTKSFCSNCKIHCYSKDKREEIKKVMRYSGPRMIFHHPLLLILHFIKSK